MIGLVLREINNYFIKDISESTEITTTIKVKNPDKFVVGQYIFIYKSILNDGVYKIEDITGSYLTLDETLQAESTKARVYGLAIPKDVLTLIGEIETYNNGNASGVQSESLGDYSVTYGSNGGTWQQVFRAKLNAYRKPYLDLRGVYHDYWCR